MATTAARGDRGACAAADAALRVSYRRFIVGPSSVRAAAAADDAKREPDVGITPDEVSGLREENGSS